MDFDCCAEHCSCGYEHDYPCTTCSGDYKPMKVTWLW